MKAKRLRSRLVESLGRPSGHRPSSAGQASAGQASVRLSEIRAVQLDEMLRLAKFTAIPQILIAAALTFFFWNAPERFYTLGLLAAVALPAFAAVTAGQIWRGVALSEAATAFGHKAAAVLALMSGVAWATLPIALFTTRPGSHEAVVAATIAGLISIVYVLGPILSASLLFAAPIVMATLFKVLLDGGPDTSTLAVLLVIYACFTVICRTLMNTLSVQRIVDRISVGEQHETIRLLLRDFEENASDWLWATDAIGGLNHVPKRLIEVSGLSENPVGTSFRDVLGGGVVAPSPGASLVLSAMDERRAFIDEIVEIGPPGSSVWWKLTGKPIHDARGFVGYRGVGTDVTAARNAELRIAFMAEHDHLTGLANRISFHGHVAIECAAIAARGGIGALLYVDLDGFKLVNDSFGHAVGDELLRGAAARIAALADGGALAARFGGDEFAVWLPTRHAWNTEAWAQALIESLAAPFTVDGRVVTVGASVGIALVPDHGTDLEALYLKADMALYRAKSEGKGRHKFFNERIEQAHITRRTLEADLTLALARREFELHYQPIVDTQSGRIDCFEALLRWRSPERGFVQPSDFIPAAEACGLIVDLGRWVLQEACRQAATWPDDVRVAINVSPRQLRSAVFLQDVAMALRTSGLAMSRLEIEITEGIFMDATPGGVETLVELRQMGIRIAIDDFGTGFSSLSYLVRFPVDKIKIDKSFVAGLGASNESQAVVEAILVLAARLRISVTAEGVETAEQAAELVHRQCGSLQGYLLSKPRPASDIPMLLKSLPGRFGALLQPDPQRPKLIPVESAAPRDAKKPRRAFHAA